MNFSDWINEENVFTINQFKSKMNLLEKDFNNLGIKYCTVNNTEDDFYPQDEGEISHIPYIVDIEGNDNIDSKIRQIKRLLLTAGWNDLGKTENILYKKDMFLRLYIGLDRVIVSVRDFL